MGVGRPMRDQVLMQIARLFALRGTCSRAQVGVVIAQDGRILVTGYNGAPRGMPHCDHACDCEFDNPDDVQEQKDVVGHQRSCASRAPCTVSVHAEANAIAFAAMYGVRLTNSEMYSTYTPCLACAQLIINCGIQRVHCMNPYRDRSGLELLIRAGLQVRDWSGDLEDPELDMFNRGG